METVVVAGALAAKPGNGGEAWVRLSWVLGLRKLGFDAWLLEEVDAAAAGAGARVLRGDRRAARARRPGGAGRARGTTGPLERPELGDLAADAAALVNVSGNLRDPDLLAAFPRRAYLDLDPGFTQIWHAEGQLGDQLERHEPYFTRRAQPRRARLPHPTGGLRWIRCRLRCCWRSGRRWQVPTFDRFTTVGTWRNPLGSLEPAARPTPSSTTSCAASPPSRGVAGLAFEIALEIHPDEAAEARDLEANGWTVVEPRPPSPATPMPSAATSAAPAAEFSVAQGVYAEARHRLGQRPHRPLPRQRPAGAGPGDRDWRRAAGRRRAC